MRNLITVFAVTICLLPVTQSVALPQFVVDMSSSHTATWLQLHDVIQNTRGLSQAGTLAGLFPGHHAILLTGLNGAATVFKDIGAKDYSNILRPAKTDLLHLIAQGNFVDSDAAKKYFITSNGELVHLTATDTTVDWVVDRSFPELQSHGNASVVRINDDPYDDYVAWSFSGLAHGSGNYCCIVLGAPTPAEMKVLKVVPWRTERPKSTIAGSECTWRMMATVRNSMGRIFALSYTECLPYSFEVWKNFFLSLEEMIVTQVSPDSTTIEFTPLDYIRYSDYGVTYTLQAQFAFNYPELKKILVMTFSPHGAKMYNFDSGKFTHYCTFPTYETVYFPNAQQNVRMNADSSIADIVIETGAIYYALNSAEFLHNDKMVFRGRIRKDGRSQLSYQYPEDGKDYYCAVDAGDASNPRTLIYKLPVVGVDEQSVTVEHMVQPNPARVGAEVTLTTEQTNQSTIAITLVTIDGREIQVPGSAVHMADNTVRFVVPNVPTGMYHLQCTVGQQTHKYKLVVID